MARDIKEGHWDSTHQGIAIASDGTLIDGQHRLLAIVEAGKSVKMNVTFNATKSSHIDSGTIRTMSNRLQMGEEGIPWVNQSITAAARVIGVMFPKEEVLKLEIEAIKKENAWSAQKGIGCKPFDDA